MFLPSIAMQRCSVKQRRRAFTIIELLVASVVIMLVVVLLTSVLRYALDAWSRNEDGSEVREKARSVISLMTNELRQAVLPLDRTDSHGLQMILDPLALAGSHLNNNALFWQAPIATSKTKGDLAVVGYFVRFDGTAYQLCRLFLNPDDPDYTVGGTQPWVTPELLDSRAMGTSQNNFQSVVLENVPGMWITAFEKPTLAYTSYDSRIAQKLPHHIVVSLALLSNAGANLVANGAVNLPSPTTYNDVTSYIAALPERLRSHVYPVTVNISMTP